MTAGKQTLVIKFQKIEDLLRAFRRLWILVAPFRAHLALCTVLILLSSMGLVVFLSSIIPLISEVTGDIGEVAPGSGYIGTLFDLYTSLPPDQRKVAFVLISLLMLLVNSGLGFAVAYTNASLSAKVVTHTRERLADRMLYSRFSFISDFNEGQLIQIITSEARGVYSVVKQTLTLIVVLVRCSILFGLLVIMSYQLTLIFVGVALFMVVINFNFVKKVKRVAGEGVELRFDLMSFSKEMITHLRQIKIDVLEERILARLGIYSQASENNVRKVRVLSELLPVVSQAFMVLTVFFMVFWSMREAIFVTGMPRLGGLLTYLIVLNALVPYIGGLNRAIGSISANIPSVSRVFDFLFGDRVLANQENTEGARRQELMKNDIVFEGARFGYENGVSRVLDGVNLRIKKGDKVAIIGRSGTGKTTLLNLLMMLYELDEGSLRIDDTDVREINVFDIRRKIGFVSQDIKLFNTTIRENLLFARPEASQLEIEGACAQSDAHDFISEMPKGYDTVVGERGEKLSGGQRQRVALAQIFLKSPDVVILDEAVSAVDVASVENIRRSIFKCFKDQTIVIVSHHANAIRDVDRVIVLENGMVREYATGDDRLKDIDSLFQDMAQSQRVP